MTHSSPPPPPHCQYFIQLGSLITSRDCQGDDAAECKAPSVGFLYDSRLPLAPATDVTQDPAALSCCDLISLTLTVLVCSCFSCTPCKEFRWATLQHLLELDIQVVRTRWYVAGRNPTRRVERPSVKAWGVLVCTFELHSVHRTTGDANPVSLKKAWHCESPGFPFPFPLSSSKDIFCNIPQLVYKVWQWWFS